MAVLERVIRVEGVPDGVEPAWEIALLFPSQGQWTEGEYLSLPDEGPAELSDGRIAVLPMPTEPHQEIMLFLVDRLRAFARPSGLGKTLPSGISVRLWPGTFRRPDIAFMRAENAHRRQREFWEGADLVVEVVSDSESDRERDLVTKRAEYAKAGIPEYWVVDTKEERILVLTLEGPAYREHGVFHRGQDATSVLLPGFAVSVDEVMESAAA